VTSSSTNAQVEEAGIATPEVELVRNWCLNWGYHRLLDCSDQPLQVPVIERFDWDGRALDPGFRRVRVIGRQLYVLSRAACGGVHGAGALAERTASALMDRAVGGDGQFVSRLSADGAVLDSAADLYDIAFALFGLAWWYRYSLDPRAIELAKTSVSLLQSKMRSPSGLGFLDRLPGPGKHLQNPHMHLFEAAIFLTVFTENNIFRSLADELFELARTRLVDGESSTLAEEFDSGWRPLIDQQGKVRIEPGHQFEWCWLLDRYAILSGKQEALDLARSLFDTAFEHGRDPESGLILDAVCAKGEPLETDLRIWPNTEFLKAQIAMAERAGQPYSDGIEATIARVFHHYLIPNRIEKNANFAPGFWIDYLKDGAKRLNCDHVPASTMYHIMFAFSEAIRFRDKHHPFDVCEWRSGKPRSALFSRQLSTAGDLR
jgi:mannose/cellobiose epimerase-like protein (N-acyl-D-glucosamine 2-epimerase family)